MNIFVNTLLIICVCGLLLYGIYQNKKMLILTLQDIKKNTDESEAIEKNTVTIDDLKKELRGFKDTYLRESGAFETRTSTLTDELRRVSQETQNLCSTLRGKATVLGTWGEEMLSRILESAGLVKGTHYEEQMLVTDEQGKKYYPDVVVHLSGGRNLILDSKVSLEQYIRAGERDDATQQKNLIKQHVSSVRSHVNELVRKKYQTLVPNALDYILMFLPHEGAFAAAVAEDDSLLSWAYSQNVIIVNPSNLMTTLLLIKNLWQREERIADAEKINAAAIKLYSKFVTFAKNFEKIGGAIDKIQTAYDSAKSQLCTGPANIVKQLTAWEEQYGIRSTETIPESLK